MRTLLHLFLLFASLIALSGCATTSQDAIDDDALYRAQDRTFRPMGNQ